MLANIGKNAQTEKFWEHEMFETCCGNLFFIGTNLRRRKNPSFFDMQPYGAENGPPFLDLQPYGAENGPPFLDLQPCGAENGHRFLTCNPAAQKTAIVF